jgi:hypothetical protein
VRLFVVFLGDICARQSSRTKQKGTSARTERQRLSAREESDPLQERRGYFEHTGRVRGNQDFGIEFTTAQLNDVLKSLTLVDLNGGRIGAVRNNSVAPLGEQLKTLQIPLSEEWPARRF